MKTIFLCICILIIAGLGALYFVNRPNQKGASLGSFENAVQEFHIDYAKLEEGAKSHPKGEELLARVRERERNLNNEDEKVAREAYELIAFDMRQLGDNEGSILGYRASLSLFENNIFAWNNLAVSYEELGEYKKAEAAYKKITEISPGDVPNYRKLADLYLYSLIEKEKEIPALMEEGLERVPNHPDLLSYLAVYWQNKGETEKAIEHYERLLKVAPLNKTAKDELNKLRQ